MTQQNLFAAILPREEEVQNETASAILERVSRHRIELSWMLDKQKKLEDLRKEAILLEHSIVKRMRGAEDQQIPILRNQLENRWKEVEKNLKEALQAELGPKKKKVLKTTKEKSSEVEEENPEEEEEVEIQSSSSKEKPALGKRKNLDQPSLQKSPKKKKSHTPEKLSSH